jgi:hypothetical protein
MDKKATKATGGKKTSMPSQTMSNAKTPNSLGADRGKAKGGKK